MQCVNTPSLTPVSVGTSPHLKGARGAEVYNAETTSPRPVRRSVAKQQSDKAIQMISDSAISHCLDSIYVKI